MVTSVIVIQIPVIAIFIPPHYAVSTNSDIVSSITTVCFIPAIEASRNCACLRIAVPPVIPWKVRVSYVIVAFFVACSDVVSAFVDNTVAIFKTDPARSENTT